MKPDAEAPTSSRSELETLPEEGDLSEELSRELVRPDQVKEIPDDSVKVEEKSAQPEMELNKEELIYPERESVGTGQGSEKSEKVDPKILENTEVVNDKDGDSNDEIIRAGKKSGQNEKVDLKEEVLETVVAVTDKGLDEVSVDQQEEEEAQESQTVAR